MKPKIFYVNALCLALLAPTAFFSCTNSGKTENELIGTWKGTTEAAELDESDVDLTWEYVFSDDDPDSDDNKREITIYMISSTQGIELASVSVHGTWTATSREIELDLDPGSISVELTPSMSDFLRRAGASEEDVREQMRQDFQPVGEQKSMAIISLDGDHLVIAESPDSKDLVDLRRIPKAG